MRKSFAEQGKTSYLGPFSSDCEDIEERDLRTKKEVKGWACHNRGVQWDTLMSRRAGEGQDWIQLMAQGPPRKEDVTFSLLASMGQATEKRTEKGGGVPTQKLRLQTEDEGMQNRGRGSRAVDLRQRVADWAILIFREHNKKADALSVEGVKGRIGEWVDTANVAWSELTGLCGFLDGSCENGTRDAGMMVQVFSKTLGWVPIHKKCGPVRGRNFLEAELCGRGMLMENLNEWINRSTHEQ